MEMDSYENGIPSWVDLGTPDPDAAAGFYSGLFGWEIQELGPDAGGYRMATLRGRNVAGLGPAQNPGPPYWATYVAVDDADAVAASVTANGGAVFAPPFDVMTAGRMGVFADPQGAVFSVWQAKDHNGAGLVNEPDTYSWSELVTTDIDASKAFYGAVFGWGADTYGEGPGAYTEWKLASRSVGGMMTKPPGMPAEVPNHWAVYFSVADIEATVARIREFGGQIMMGPMKIEPGTFAVATDPQGAPFNVMELKPVGDA